MAIFRIIFFHFCLFPFRFVSISVKYICVCVCVYTFFLHSLSFGSYISSLFSTNNWFFVILLSVERLTRMLLRIGVTQNASPLLCLSFSLSLFLPLVHTPSLQRERKIFFSFSLCVVEIFIPGLFHFLSNQQSQ